MKAIICRSCSYRLRWVWARRPQLQKQQQLCGPPPPASVAAPPLIHARPRAVHKQHSEKQRQRAPLTTLKGYLLFYSDINHRAPTCGSMRRYSVKRPDTRTKCKKATRGIFLIKVRPQHNNSIHLQLPNYHTYNKSQGFFFTLWACFKDAYSILSPLSSPLFTAVKWLSRFALAFNLWISGF